MADRNKLKEIFCQTIPLIKLIGYLLIIYYAGIIKGIIYCILLYKTYYFCMSKIFGLEPFSAGDLIFVWNPKEECYNMMAVLVFDSLNTKSLEKLLIEKGNNDF